MLLQNTQTGQTVGPLGNGARIERQVTDLTAQPLKETGEPLDFAIDGDGFFAVQTPQGVRYTRNGQFTAAANGRLVDQRNNPVLGQNGQPLTVGADGKVDRRRTSASSPSPTRARAATTSSPAPPAAAARARCAPARSRARAPSRRARWST